MLANVLLVSTSKSLVSYLSVYQYLPFARLQEQVAWYLYQQNQWVSILLPNKAKHYLMSLGHKRSAAAVQQRPD